MNSSSAGLQVFCVWFLQCGYREMCDIWHICGEKRKWSGPLKETRWDFSGFVKSRQGVERQSGTLLSKYDFYGKLGGQLGVLQLGIFIPVRIRLQTLGENGNVWDVLNMPKTAFTRLAEVERCVKISLWSSGHLLVSITATKNKKAFTLLVFYAL